MLVKDTFNGSAVSLDSKLSKCGPCYDPIRASEKGDLVVVRGLISDGVDVDNVDEEGWTALIIASGEDHLAMVKELISPGADVDNTNAEGRINHSLRGGHISIVEELTSAGADVDKKTGYSV